MEAEFEKSSADCIAVRSALAEAQERMTSTIADVEAQAQAKVAHAETALQEAQAAAARLTAERDDALAAVNVVTSERDDAQTRAEQVPGLAQALDGLKTERTALEAAVAQLQSQLDSSTVQLNDLNDKLKAAAEDNKRLSTKAANLETNNKAKLAKAASDAQALQAAVAQATAARDDAAQRANALQSEVDALKTEAKETAMKIKELIETAAREQVAKEMEAAEKNMQAKAEAQARVRVFLGDAALHLKSPGLAGPDSSTLPCHCHLTRSCALHFRVRRAFCLYNAPPGGRCHGRCARQGQDRRGGGVCGAWLRAHTWFVVLS